MTTDPGAPRPSRRAGSILATVGGSAAALGSVLDWASVTARRGRSAGAGAGVVANGSDLFGPFTVAAGLAAVIGGLLLLVARSARARAGLGALALAGGLVAGGLGLYVVVSDAVVIEALAEERGAPRAGRRADVSPQAGLYVVIVGGALAAAGGLAGLLSARERASTERAAADVLDAPPPPGDNTPTFREGETT